MVPEPREPGGGYEAYRTGPHEEEVYQ
jgi:hypothetical protein